MTRVIWQLPTGYTPTSSDISAAVAAFFTKYKISPNVIKMSYAHMDQYISNFQNVQQPIVLDSGKKYANYVITSCGPIRLEIADDFEEFMPSNVPLNPIIIVENTEVDAEFEKQILNV